MVASVSRGTAEAKICLVGDGKGLVVVAEGIGRGEYATFGVGAVVTKGVGGEDTTVVVEESRPPKHPESTHAAEAAIREIIIDFRIGKY